MSEHLEELGQTYIDEGEPVDFTNKYDFGHKFSNKIINSAKYLGYDAMLTKDQKGVQSEQSFEGLRRDRWLFGRGSRCRLVGRDR